MLPLIPHQPSLRPSPHLPPLSHLPLPLIAQPNVFFKGQQVDTPYLLNQLNPNPIQLQPKHPLPLINPTQPITPQPLINYIQPQPLPYQP
ncbi:aromatic amino acid lyase, partial [Staphylococcus saprophyticus]|uniref:aromatic amino acid lyase n=1 Tax=Staphylococcus saprophyticus TaxID=29385 RepID=UPI0021B2EF45